VRIGLARTRLAKSVLMLLGNPGSAAGGKAVRYERQFVKVSPVVPVIPVVLGMWVRLREEAPRGQALHLHAVWCH